MFRKLRIAILLTILVVVAGNQWLTAHRLGSWEKPLWVTVYPVLVDSKPSIRDYAESLEAESFRQIRVFLKQQAARYGLKLDDPVIFQVANPLNEAPPELPAEDSGLKIALWSLKMRWWSWRHDSQEGLAPADIRMYVIYQDRIPNALMERSVGVQNGSYGVVHAEPSRLRAAQNRIVITHELLHILGAADKYDLYTGQPVEPDGLANPGKLPLYPQDRAEIMGGRVATSAYRWAYPASLEYCVIGSKTAAEIGW